MNTWREGIDNDDDNDDNDNDANAFRNVEEEFT